MRVECPWCEHAIRDLWDYDWHNRESIEIECPTCDQPVTLTVHASYSAQKTPAKVGAR